MQAGVPLRMAFALTLLLVPPWLCATPLKPDEQVLFLPQVAVEQPDGRVALRIEAWVHEREPRRLLHWAFTRYLRIDVRLARNHTFARITVA